MTNKQIAQLVKEPLAAKEARLTNLQKQMVEVRADGLQFSTSMSHASYTDRREFAVNEILAGASPLQTFGDSIVTLKENQQ